MNPKLLTFLSTEVFWVFLFFLLASGTLKINEELIRDYEKFPVPVAVETNFTSPLHPPVLSQTQGKSSGPCRPH